jgi:hypothetical protein
MAAVTRLMALTITHESKVSAIIMQDIVRAAHDSHDDTMEALRYAVDEISILSGESTSLGDILGAELWSAN